MDEQHKIMDGILGLVAGSVIYLVFFGILVFLGFIIFFDPSVNLPDVLLIGLYGVGLIIPAAVTYYIGNSYRLKRPYAVKWFFIGAGITFGTVVISSVLFNSI